MYVDATLFCRVVTLAYEEVVHWKQNLFLVPFGKSGNQFVSELTRLYKAYAEEAALESIALKATTVLSILALQKPHCNLKAIENASYLERRLSGGTGQLRSC